MNPGFTQVIQFHLPLDLVPRSWFNTVREEWTKQLIMFQTVFSHVFSCWRHQMETCSALLALCGGNSPVDSPHKGQWRVALMFCLIFDWPNGWANNRDAGDLGRHLRILIWILMTIVSMCPIHHKLWWIYAIASIQTGTREWPTPMMTQLPNDIWLHLAIWQRFNRKWRH